MSIISVKNLRKNFRSFDRREGISGSFKDLFHRRYKTVEAVKSISFSVERGELLGYIGPNGAGKSTSIKMLTGILKPDGGEIRVDGFEPFAQRQEYVRHIGVVFGQRTQLWWDIAAIESFNLLARIYRIDQSVYRQRLDTLSQILELKDLLHTPVRKLSLGQRMRCDIAASLLHNPPVLFLDEPTIGLDAIAKESIRAFLRTINDQFKTTIILTTHDLREIEELCSRIMVLDHGSVVYDGSLEAIRSLPGLEREIIVDFQTQAPLAEINAHFNNNVHFEQLAERRLRARFDPQKLPATELLRQIVSKYSIADVAINEPEIEQVIMKIYRSGTGEAIESINHSNFNQVSI